MNQAEGFLIKHNHTSKDDFRTPKYLIEWINKKYGPIEFDGACTPGINNLFSPLSLEEEWPSNSIIYSNPPWDSNSIIKWFQKGLKHTKKGGVHIMLIPNKLCQKSLVENVNPYIETLVFLGGRINFEGPFVTKGGSSRTGCLLLINGLDDSLSGLFSINLSEIKASRLSTFV
jgi:hypothetical protein